MFKKTFKFVLKLALLAVVVYTFVYLWKQSQTEEKLYETVQPELRTLQKTTVATGKLEPRDEVNIKPKIQGIITELYVQTGDKVSVGTKIAKIAVTPEVAQLSNAQSQLRSAELTLAQKERDFERCKSLYEQGVVAREEYERSETELATYREQVAEARDQVEIITRGISSRVSDVNSTVVTSTINGTILDLPIKVGSSVQAIGTFTEGTTVAVIADMSDIIFRGNVDESEVGRMHLGMPMVLTIGALQNVSIDASLEYIAPKGYESNGAVLFEVKAAAHIPDSLAIRAGYSANADIILQKRDKVLSLPEGCVELDKEGAAVYVLSSAEDVVPQEFERRAVKLGMSDGLYIEVLSGVTENDKIRK